MLDKDAESAKTLVLVAIILEVVATVIVIFAFSFEFAIGTAVTSIGSSNPVTLAPFFGLLLVIAASFSLVGLLWILLDYFLLYKKIAEGNIEETESPSLILGILQLLFGGLISGILILVAHGKISNSIINRLRNKEEKL